MRWVLPLALALGCCSEKRRDPPPVPVPSVAVPAVTPAEPAPRVLYVPDAAPPPEAPSPVVVPRATSAHCPPEMVWVRSSFCIDRFEVTLVEQSNGQALSPYYFPSPQITRREYEKWQRRRAERGGPEEAKGLLVPSPPEWELAAPRFEPVAFSQRGVVPSGYLSGQISERVCERAGKRLCTPDEWVTACRGEKNRKFPYGDVYEDGRCNVHRGTHPARVLHGDPSTGHLDPRLNQVCEAGDPLLRKTGETASCASEWETDAVYDMVGNLDEWVMDDEGTFLGGFYARSTKEGCDSRVEVHAYDYYDYSLGTRCCR